MGIDVDEEPRTFEDQLRLLIQGLQKADPAQLAQVLRGVIVGNEAIHRGDVTVEELVDYIRQTRLALSESGFGEIRVSASDVFGVYTESQLLVDAVDFMTPNT